MQKEQTVDREQIYREVAHEYHVQDAESQVEFYLECKDVNPQDFEGTFDYDYMATVFEENHDCSISDNAQWHEIIEAYVKENGIDFDTYKEEIEERTNLEFIMEDLENEKENYGLQNVQIPLEAAERVSDLEEKMEYEDALRIALLELRELEDEEEAEYL